LGINLLIKKKLTLQIIEIQNINNLNKNMEIDIKKRPELNNKISLEDFKHFYWLKTELVSFCRANGVTNTGCKIEIADRIEQYLAKGESIPTFPKQYTISNFDWKNAELNLNTKLKDNYKNTENVRAFMTLHIGPHFKFNTEFMNWAKANTGKSLSDAINEWKRIYTLKKDKEYKSEIAPQFEYNRYIRDFIADNKGSTINDAIKYWKVKRGMSGDKKYSKNDLNLKIDSQTK